MTPPICALCKLPMRPDPEAPGVWRCPDDETHEFHEDADAEPLPAVARRFADTEFKLPCPRCRDTDMVPVAGTTGAWRCTADPAHEFMAGEKAGAEQPRPAPVTPRTWPDAPQILTATQGMPYFRILQRSMGIMGPISRAPQSNITDGRRCLLTGPVAHGGGSKSGRSRKKGDKGGKKFVDSPWGEGGTNAK